MPLVHVSSLEGLNRLQCDAKTIAVLPVAATEAHGPHLPATTDCDIARGHLAALEAHLPGTLDVVVLPLQTIGASQEHCRFETTRSKDVATLVSEWFALARAVADKGARRLVVVSSHGGNTAAVDTLILRARAELNCLAVGTAWLRFGHPEGLFSEAERRYGIHGGDIETSLMLHYAPHAVDMTQAGAFASALMEIEHGMVHLSAYGRHRFGWLSTDLHPLGVVGNAALASREKGARLALHILTGFAELLDEVAGFDLGWLK